jgi:hypothetical protein
VPIKGTLRRKRERVSMSKKDTLRFKVCVSSGYAEFYEHLKEFGPYYRSRRLLQLAQIGFSLQKGMAISAAIQMPAVTVQTPAEVSSSPRQTHYNFSDDATNQIAGMLDALDTWGTA